MVENKHYDKVFHALADGTRRQIVAALAAGGEHSVSTLSAPHTISLAAISKHLRVLEGAGLVQRRVAGRQHFLRLNPTTLALAQDWLSFHLNFWNERLNALERLLEASVSPQEES
ncbi:MAG: metalloregulator ArsR/SmtB family transcription factor [Gammaproteobacteria bacterium]|nr:metalloregulator ArsR/SmtB family transcription factor [Gammaproteobacteria bacterium]